MKLKGENYECRNIGGLVVFPLAVFYWLYLENNIGIV